MELTLFATLSGFSLPAMSHFGAFLGKKIYFLTGMVLSKMSSP